MVGVGGGGCFRRRGRGVVKKAGRRVEPSSSSWSVEKNRVSCDADGIPAASVVSFEIFNEEGLVFRERSSGFHGLVVVQRRARDEFGS